MLERQLENVVRRLEAQSYELALPTPTGDRERMLARAAPPSLSMRERHILRYLAAGWTNREIGAELGLSTGTVKNQVARVLSKLNVTDRTQAAVRAVLLGLVDTAE
jgi:DNA-binding NarL/FixJ family response regulator